MDLFTAMLRTLIATLALGSSLAAAQVRAHAVRRAGAIAIDGHLDEPDWQNAPKQGGFTQRYPQDGGHAGFDTQFAILYDDDAVYIGVWANDPDPSRIRNWLVRRDLDTTTDAIAVGIDSYQDKRTAFVFQLNAAGVQRDMLVFDDTNGDDTWDAVWTGDSAITDHGWTAEFRIPLNQLRFSSDDVQQWGFQIVRVVGRTLEQDAWSPWPRSGPQVVSRFGVVEGIEHVTPGRRLELLPYATAGLDVEPIQAGDPLNDHVGMRRNVGLDLKYGLSRAFTLSATLNPDFGQVEADPSQVNLGPTELFFAEKRPFFLEGVDLFKLPIGNSDGSVEGAFYSRRIGAVPPPPDMDYQYVRAPVATTIYGAAKLTGKTKSGWSVGMLDAITGDETTAVIDNNGNRQQSLVAPTTNFAVARVKRDFNDGKTTVGMSATAVDRVLDGTVLASSLRDQAYTGGLQLSHRWGDDAWQVDVHSVGSWVHGTTDAITALQQDNVHLYQRPDAHDVHFDPMRTSLSGMGLTAIGGRIGATEHWRVGGGGDLRTPGLELNDAGFQTSSDRMIPFIWAQYRDDSPGENFLNYQVNSDVYAVENFDPLLLAYGLESNASAQLANYWSLNFYSNLARNRWDTVALRGGDALHVDPTINANANLQTDNRKRVWGSLGLRVMAVPAIGTHVYGTDLGATIQARSNLDFTIGPSITLRDDPMQYVTEVDDSLGMPHYIFASIHQVTTAVTARVNWTFSPHLSLQAYAQPFVSAGSYSNYKDVDHPHAASFADRFTPIAPDTFMFDRPDFDLRQIRSTVVLRWEYRPGSTVFAIWSHGQTSQLDQGQYGFSRDAGGVFSAPSQNLLMIKANYWIGL